MGERRGHRGYLASRPVRGSTTPQRVQNLVVRDYCSRRGLSYLVSAAEYAMPQSYMMLENILAELPKIEGIVLFTAFMLPPDRHRRAEIYRRVFEAGATLHAALENIALTSRDYIPPFEDLLSVALLLEHAPLGGRYPKTERALADTDSSFVAAILSSG